MQNIFCQVSLHRQLLRVRFSPANESVQKANIFADVKSVSLSHSRLSLRSSEQMFVKYKIWQTVWPHVKQLI